MATLATDRVETVAETGSVRRLEFALGPLVPEGEPVVAVADLHWPAHLAERPLLLVCVPGGGVRRGYFDMQGDADEAFSFARAMGAEGHVLLTIDPPGVGESTRPLDGFSLTAEILAEAHHRLMMDALDRMTDPAGRQFRPAGVVGVGHSAGAMLQVMQQAKHRDYAALLLFCYGDGGLPDRLDDEQRAALGEPRRGRARFPEFARRRFEGRAYIPAPSREADSAAARAMRRVHDQVIAVIGVHAMTPGGAADELAAIDVPVMLAVGDRDMTGPPADLGASYRSCPDYTLHVVPTSGHHVFVAPAAPRLYARTAGWLDLIAKG